MRPGASTGEVSERLLFAPACTAALDSHGSWCEQGGGKATLPPTPTLPRRRGRQRRQHRTLAASLSPSAADQALALVALRARRPLRRQARHRRPTHLLLTALQASNGPVSARRRRVRGGRPAPRSNRLRTRTQRAWPGREHSRQAGRRQRRQGPPLPSSLHIPYSGVATRPPTCSRAWVTLAEHLGVRPPCHRPLRRAQGPPGAPLTGMTARRPRQGWSPCSRPAARPAPVPAPPPAVSCCRYHRWTAAAHRRPSRPSRRRPSTSTARAPGSDSTCAATRPRHLTLASTGSAASKRERNSVELQILLLASSDTTSWRATTTRPRLARGPIRTPAPQTVGNSPMK